MQTTFGLNVPMTLEDICHSQKMALLVYDMQVGIAKQLPDGAEFTQKVKQVVDTARSRKMRVFFSRHTTLPKELARVSQLKSAMALQGVKADQGYVPVLIQDACYSFSEENRSRSLQNLHSSSLITDITTALLIN
jgi:biuret amidohydrolase